METVQIFKEKKTYGLYDTEQKDLICVLVEMIIYMIYNLMLKQIICLVNCIGSSITAADLTCIVRLPPKEICI